MATRGDRVNKARRHLTCDAVDWGTSKGVGSGRRAGRRLVIKKLLGFVIAMPLLAIFAVPVSAQEEPPCTPTAHGSGNAAGCTVNFHNLTDTFTDVVPCTDPPVPAVISISNANAIFHITTLANGTYWATFTEQGNFVAVAANGLTYTGHFAMWDGEN